MYRFNANNFILKNTILNLINIRWRNVPCSPAVSLEADWKSESRKDGNVCHVQWYSKRAKIKQELEQFIRNDLGVLLVPALAEFVLILIV